MKKVISIYHPRISHKIEKLSNINTEHAFFSTFSILELIEEKNKLKSFHEIISINDLFDHPFFLSFSNNKLIFEAGDISISLQSNLDIYDKTSDCLLRVSKFRLFLHQVEELLLELVVRPCIIETTSFVHPNEKITSIELVHEKDNYLNPASLFLNYNDNYIDLIENYIIKPQFSYLLSFNKVNYNNFFAQNPNNKSIESLKPLIKKHINRLQKNSVFDTFDLEIQSLALTTLYNEVELKNQSLVTNLVEDALVVIKERYKRFNKIIPALELLTPKGIFQGKTRYWFEKDRIYAVPTSKQGIDKSKAVEIEFRLMDKDLALDFIECFHYIHNRHDFDYAFGFFIKGEVYPYAVSLLEKISPRLYKEEFIRQVGIDPERVLDEIRLYSLSWCPMTTSSVLSYKVRDFIRSNIPNIKYTITAVNRNIFSGTYIHQAGYIPLAFKPARLGFNEFNFNNKIIPYYNGSDPELPKHSIQPLLPTVEYYRPIRKNDHIETNGEVFDISYEHYQQ